MPEAPHAAGSRRRAYLELVREHMRTALLDAAYDTIVERGWAETPLADIAAAAGVSRQTVYNEFGSKDGLAQQVVLRETSRFLDGIDAALAGAGAEVAAGIDVAVRFTLRTAQDNPLVKAILISARDDELLPFLTTRVDPVLTAGRDLVLGYFTEHLPGHDRDELRAAAEITARLTISHVVLSLEPAETSARVLTRFITRFLAIPDR